MTQVKRTLLHAVLGSMLATGALLAQEPPPMEAFKAVHLVALTASQASTLRAALADLNAAVAAAGHPEVRYQLYKVVGKQAGTYNYMWESSWPSGAVYGAVHKSPAYQMTVKKHPEVDALMKNEIYNRYVEEASAKP